MLDPWIIEEILKREERAREEREQLRIEVPMDRPFERPSRSGEITVVNPPQPPAEENQRGVVVIDI